MLSGIRRIEVYVKGVIESDNTVVHFDDCVSIFEAHKAERHRVAKQKILMALSPRLLGGMVIAEDLLSADSQEEITCVHEISRLMIPGREKELERFLLDANRGKRAEQVFEKLLEVIGNRLPPKPNNDCQHCRIPIRLSLAQQQGKSIRRMRMTMPSATSKT